MPTTQQVRKALTDLSTKRAETERKIADAQRKKAAKEKEAADRRRQAERTSSATSARSYLRQAETAQNAAQAESAKIATLSKKLSGIATDEGKQSKNLSDALKSEATAQARADQKARRAREQSDRQAEQQRKQEDRRRQQERLQDQRTAAALITQTEERLSEQIEAIREPRKEQLRILYATATPDGDLRLDQEIRRVKAVVQASTHRDQVLIEHLPAATPGDLLDGLTAFRPHVVHFSGHANEQVLGFDDGSDEGTGGTLVPARAFKAAVEAPDEPPMLVVLNACKSEAQLAALLGTVPAAIGMADSIGDVDAITFATRFYRSLAEGQSIAASLAAARAEMEMNGLDDHDLPTILTNPGIDPADIRLVVPPS